MRVFRVTSGLLTAFLLSAGLCRAEAPRATGTACLPPTLSGQFTLGALPTGTRAVAFMPGGRVVIAVSTDGNVQVHDVPKKESIRDFSLARPGKLLSAVAILPADSLIAAGYSDGQIILWPVESDKPSRSLSSFQRPVTCLSGDPAGGHLAAGSSLGTIDIWHPATAERVFHKAAHGSAITGLALQPGGELLASMSIEGQMALWNVTTGLRVARLHRPPRPPPEKRRDLAVSGISHPMAFNDDGTLLAAATADEAISWWRISAPDRRETTQAPTTGQAVTCLCFLPHSTCLLLARPITGTALVDLESGREYAMPQAFPTPVLCLDFSGSRLIVGGNDPQICLWRLGAQVPAGTGTAADSTADIEEIAGWAPLPTAADLEVSVVFEEPSGNGQLDTCEEGAVIITVRNPGAAKRDDVLIHVRGDRLLSIGETPLIIGELFGGESVSARLTLRRSDNSAATGEHLEFTALARDGNRSPVTSLAVPLADVSPPKLRADEPLIAGRTGALLPDRRRTPISVNIRNEGAGPARNVRVALTSPTAGVSIDETDEFALGDLMPGAVAEVVFYLTVNARLTGGTVAVDLQANEDCGLFSRMIRLGFAVAAPADTDPSGG